MTNKAVSIKEATDKQLDELLIRLRKESEAQTIIADLKRKSMPDGQVSYGRPEVSTEQPVESLYHFGVLGMKWGVRKGRVSVRGKGPVSEDHVKSRQLKSKGTKRLSTSELKELTNRLQLEKQYKDLTPKKYEKGHDVAKEVLALATTASGIYALAKSPLAQQVAKAIKGKMR